MTTWPSGCSSGCGIENQKLYLQTGGALRFAGAVATPAKGMPDFESYVADPAKPIPFIPRPVHIEGEAGEARWQTWLVSDQRDVASRTDVLSFSTPPLSAAVKISGEPIANLIAATSGTMAISWSN